MPMVEVSNGGTLETKDFAIPASSTSEHATSQVNLSYQGHELIGAAITTLNIYTGWSGTSIYQSLSISNNIATISVTGTSGRILSGNIRAFYS